jgi:hypothetical protein
LKKVLISSLFALATLCPKSLQGIEKLDPQPPIEQPTDKKPLEGEGYFCALSFDPQPKDSQPIDPQPEDETEDKKPLDGEGYFCALPFDPQPQEPQPEDETKDKKPLDGEGYFCALPFDPQPIDPQPEDETKDKKPSDGEGYFCALPFDPQPIDPQPEDETKDKKPLEGEGVMCCLPCEGVTYPIVDQADEAFADLIPYVGVESLNLVGVCHGISFEEAKEMAVANEAVTFFFWTQANSMALELADGSIHTFSHADAVFFSGDLSAEEVSSLKDCYLAK